MRIQIDFARLLTPAEHCDVLVEPAAELLPALVEQNRALTERYDFSILDLSVREVREMVRREVTERSDEPFIVTGHQPDFIHAGVWAKHVASMRLAQAVGGTPLNLVVDQDAPKMTALAVPHLSADKVTTRLVPYADWPRGAAFEFMPATGETASRRLAAEVRRLLGGHYDQSVGGIFFRAYVEGAGLGDWVDQAVASRRHVEQSLGVSVLDRRVGRIWCGPLLGAMLVEPDRFAAAYNQALARYRRAHGLRRADRPAPDLLCGPERCESAVWAYRAGEPRRRVFVARHATELRLYADDEPIAALDRIRARRWHQLEPQLRALSPWVLRPRALALTLWARLLPADLFIHGIGGAKYDRATDDLIRNYFNVEPPGIACVSATMRLKLPEHHVPAGAVQRARRRLRDIQFNPQRYIDTGPAKGIAAMRAEAIRESLRLRAEEPRNRSTRRHNFQRIRECNERMNALMPGARQALLDERDAIEQRAIEDRDARRRDYFFAMHARSELAALLERMPGVQDFSRSAIV